MIVKNNLSKFLDVESEKKEKNILFFDFHNLLYRNVHVANFHVPEDTEFEYWKYLMVNSLLTTIKKFKPDEVICAIDAKPSWRKSIYSDYKSRRRMARKKSTVDFDAFFLVANKFMEDIKKSFTNIYFLEIEKAEADDIIAILSKEFIRDSDVIIISSDRDYMQLLKNPNTKLYDPIKKAFVKCINPKKELDLKVITGDKSDDIPAIKPKCGPKTAQKILDAGIEKELTDNNIRENYKRNKILIDFDFIPKDIIESIKEGYNNYDHKTYIGNKIWQFMIDNNIRRFVDDLGYYSTSLRNLNPKDEKTKV